MLDGSQLLSIVDGLSRNDIISQAGYSHLLTGYIGSPSFLRAVLSVLKTLRQSCSDDSAVSFFCDPVLGDEGKVWINVILIIYKCLILFVYFEALCP